MQVKKILKEKGIQVKDVAEALGISRVSLHGMVLAPDCNPKLSTLKKIADEVGCDYLEFLTDEMSEDTVKRIRSEHPTLSVIVDYGGEVRKATTIEEARRMIDEVESRMSAATESRGE